MDMNDTEILSFLKAEDNIQPFFFSKNNTIHV